MNKRIFNALVAMLLILSMVTPTVAQTVSATGAAEVASSTTVLGRVTDLNGEGIANVTIIALAEPYTAFLPLMSTSGTAQPSLDINPSGSGQNYYTVETDEQGYYSLESLPPGRYVIAAREPGRDFEPLKYTVVTSEGGVYNFEEVVIPTIFAPNAIQLSPEALAQIESVSEDGETYVFASETAELQQIEEGTVLVGGISAKTPEGFLRRVTSVSRQGGKVIFETEQAELTDAFESLSVNATIRLTSDQVRPLTDTPGVTGVQQASASYGGKLSFQLNNFVLYDVDNNENTTYDQLLVSLRIDQSPVLEIRILIQDFQLQEFYYNVILARNDSLKLSWNMSWSLIKNGDKDKLEKNLWTIPLTPIPIGAVVITPQFDLLATLAGEVSSRSETSIDTKMSFTGGLWYLKDQPLRLIKKYKDNVTFNPPNITQLGKLSVTGTLDPKISFKLYGVVGAYVKGSVGPNLTVAPLADPWLELKAEAQGAVGVEVGLSSLLFSGQGSSAKLEWVLYKNSYPLWSLSAREGNRPPDSPKQPFPQDGMIFTRLETPDLQLKWKASDPDKNDTLTFDVYFDTTNPPATKVASRIESEQFSVGILQPYTRYYWQVVAIDQTDKQARSPVWEFMIQAASRPPSPPNHPSPADGSVFHSASRRIQLSWSASDPDQGDILKYDVYLNPATANPFTPIVTGLRSSTFFYQVPYLGVTYYWKVVAIDRAGNIKESPVWSFTPYANRQPNQPGDPSPADGATLQASSTYLSWNATDPNGDALKFDVYLDTNNPPTRRINQENPSSSTFVGDLQPNTTYYWKVVAYDRFGSSTAGPVWSFRTQAANANRPPGQPSKPNPADGAESVSYLYVPLGWSATDPDGDNLDFDVYLDVSNPPTNKVAEQIGSTNYSVENLQPNTTYFWKVVAYDSDGLSTASPVWSFRTRTENHPPDQPQNPSVTFSGSSGWFAWSAADPDGDDLTFDAYLDTNSSPTTQVANRIRYSHFQVDNLQPNTTYFWKVVAYDSDGLSTASPVWSVFVPDIFTSGLEHLALGNGHSCVVTDAGAVKCWGDNWHGQLGNGTTTDSSTPVQVQGLIGVQAIAAGYGHTCALTNSGEVKCWGDNDSYQLGDAEASSYEPTPVSVISGSENLSGIKQIAAGAGHTCALTQDGQVKCWGAMWYGLGDARELWDSPQVVQGLSSQDPIKAIAAGYSHTCALTQSGAVKCWGNNEFGQLGDGTTTTNIEITAVSVIGLSNVIAIAAGGDHTCALTQDGQVKCWGANWRGQLGDGTTTDRLTPVSVIGLPTDTDVHALALGVAHTCALTQDGQVKCWGYNEYGQLGDGTTDDSISAVSVSGLSDVIAIAAGDYHTCALTQSGAVKCWGYNEYGQLGNGTTTNSSTPVTVSGSP